MSNHLRKITYKKYEYLAKTSLNSSGMRALLNGDV
jgi:hypothetical protein